MNSEIISSFDKKKKIKPLFGAQVWMHIPKEKRKKLDLKSTKGIFLGYGESTKGLIVYFPSRKILFLFHINK